MHTPKMEMDSFAKGTIWCVLGSPSELAAFKPKGNVPTKTTSTQ